MMHDSQRLRVLIADDHDVLRDGLRRLIETEDQFEVCGEACDGRQAVDLATRLQPDLVILDVSMPELNGLEATRYIRNAAPEAEVLILTMHESESLARDAVAAGAHGLLSKTDARRHLVPALQSLAAHTPYFAGPFVQQVVGAMLQSRRRRDDAFDGLTPREREIVQLVAEGRTSREVANHLGLSAKTVETHRANVMRKLGLRSQTDLVKYAVRNKLVQP